MNVIIDTSVWIHFFKGKDYPDVESALQDGKVYLTPVIAAELLSGVSSKQEEKDLLQFINTLPLIEGPLSHWIRVGQLRNLCSKKGLSCSTPDVHIAQTTLDLNGILYTSDKIFIKLASVVKFGLKIFD